MKCPIRSGVFRTLAMVELRLDTAHPVKNTVNTV